MLLAGDIGGTKTVLALFDESNPKAIQKEQRYVSKDYEGLDVIVRKFLTDNPCEVVSSCFGVAGPVDNGKCKTTNLPWMVDEVILAECVGTKKTRVINDLEAMAWSVEILDKDDMVCIHKGREIDDNRGVIAAGTGLGEAGIWYGTRYHPFGSEGGHADFSPKSHEEDALLSFLRNKFQNVSWERVLSGPGIENIFEFLVNTYREKPAAHVVEKMKEEIPAAVITAAALARECPACIRTMEMFVGLYGAEAGNLALKLMAFGGMYIGGGIAPKILPLLDSDTFRDAFLRKGRFRDALSRIPIYVIMTSKAPLLGAAHVADLLAHDQPIF